MANEGSTIYQRYEKAARNWLNNVLMPLFQNAQQQKQLLDAHVLKLRSLANAEGNADDRIAQMQSGLENIENQISDVDDMIRGLRKPAPIHQQKKVIPLITAQFSPPARGR